MRIVEADIEDDVYGEAKAVLDRCGLSLSDAISILLIRIAREGRLPNELLPPSAEHDRWFERKVATALGDSMEIGDEAVGTEFAARRAKARG